MSKTRTDSSKKLFIVLLIVLLLALAVGYAAFTDTLQISGTANANGTFDLQFIVDANVEENGCCVVSSEGVERATISLGTDDDGDANDKLTVAVEDLQYPGAGAEFQAVIKNVGSIPAKVTAVNLDPDPTTNSNAIRVEGLDQITTSPPTIEPKGTCTFTFTVKWDPEVTELDSHYDGENINDTTEKFLFTLDLEYEQDTENFTVNTVTHTDANGV